MTQRRPDSPYSALERNLGRLGMTMLVGAVADLVIAFVALVLPSWLVRYMGEDVTRTSLSLQFWPLVHLVFPCFYIMAWMDPKRNVVIVAGAIMARLIYAVFMIAAALGRAMGLAWLLDGAISLALALAHYVYLRRSDFGLWDVFIRAGNPPGLEK
jgi:hypothetical protein